MLDSHTDKVVGTRKESTISALYKTPNFNSPSYFDKVDDPSSFYQF